MLELLASREGSKRLDLGDGRVAVREYESVWLERGPVRLDRPVRWGRWVLKPRVQGLWVRSWRAGDRLAAIGGTVQVPVHLDCVVLEPTVEIDAETVVRDGELVV